MSRTDKLVDYLNLKIIPSCSKVISQLLFMGLSELMLISMEKKLLITYTKFVKKLEIKSSLMDFSKYQNEKKTITCQ